jgi:hypothetical protein
MNCNIFFDSFSKFFTETDSNLITCTIPIREGYVMFKLLKKLLLQKFGWFIPVAPTWSIGHP